MRPQGRIQAVLFDLDGTLLDSLKDLADSVNVVLRRRGLPVHPEEAYRSFVGEGMERLVQRALPEESRSGALLQECVADLREEYARRWDRTTRPYPGIPDLLDALVARSLPIAVLSNKPHEFTRACVARLLPRWNFSAVLGAGEEVPHKPDPAGAVAIASRLAVPREAVLFLGDGPTDVLAAIAAGMIPVGALWGFRSEAELRAAGARLLLHHPLELLPLL
jgi:phosphoglycolate phosphatase